jgi:hypothetical protein
MRVVAVRLLYLILLRVLGWIILLANTTCISVYVLGLDDKAYLARTYGGSIGKASVTGYCIKFRHLAVINVEVLQAAIQYGMSVHQAG